MSIKGYPDMKEIFKNLEGTEQGQNSNDLGLSEDLFEIIDSTHNLLHDLSNLDDQLNRLIDQLRDIPEGEEELLTIIKGFLLKNPLPKAIQGKIEMIAGNEFGYLSNYIQHRGHDINLKNKNYKLFLLLLIKNRIIVMSNKKP